MLRFQKTRSIHEEDPRPRVVEPYRPPIPFPQCLAKVKLEAKFEKFLEILKKLQINIAFLDVISEMPSYAKFLKEILSNKRKLQEHSMVSLTEECSAILQNKLLPKLEDPCSFSIPCAVGDVSISRALCDLGASVSHMPYSICKRLQVGELKPTSISIQLTDRSVKYPIGMLEDVPLQVGKFFTPCDFVVMEMEEDSQIPIILGRPFLATAGATIDVKNGRLSLHVGEEKLEFNLSKVTAPSLEDACYRVDVIEEVVLEEMCSLNSPSDPLEGCLLGTIDRRIEV